MKAKRKQLPVPSDVGGVETVKISLAPSGTSTRSKASMRLLPESKLRVAKEERRERRTMPERAVYQICDAEDSSKRTESPCECCASLQRKGYSKDCPLSSEKRQTRCRRPTEYSLVDDKDNDEPICEFCGETLGHADEPGGRCPYHDSEDSEEDEQSLTF